MNVLSKETRVNNHRVRFFAELNSEKEVFECTSEVVDNHLNEVVFSVCGEVSLDNGLFIVDGLKEGIKKKGLSKNNMYVKIIHTAFKQLFGFDLDN